MTKTKKRKTKKQESAEREELVAYWDEVMQLAPGYDPVATAHKEHYFDYDAAQRVVNFFHTCLKFVEGDVAHQPFILQPWAQCIVGNLFGWQVRVTPGDRLVRRYREGMVLVARKNNKTTLGAGIMLYTLFCDGEARAQCYSMAAETKQASFAFDIAKLMVMAEPSLASRCRPYHASIVHTESASYYKPMSAEAYSKHSMNPHAVLSDELHCQQNRDLYDAMKTGMLARRQPFMLHITTSDFDGEGSICNELVDYSCEVRDGTIDNPRWLPVIWECDKSDSYDDEAAWAKANPNLGHSVKVEDLREFAKQAKHNLAWRSTFKRLHMNQRTEQAVEIIPMEDWEACNCSFEEEELVGRACYAGLDLSERQDITAWVLLFEPDSKGDPWVILPRFWCPRSVATQRQEVNRWPYMDWEDQGFLTLCDGEVIDYGMIEDQVIEDAERFGFQECVACPWNLAYIQQRVLARAGIEIINFGQGFPNFTEPIKDLLAMLAARTIIHGGNPVLTWMARYCAALQDRHGNIMFDKSNKRAKIDGLVATVMALGLARNTGNESSAWDKQGLFIL